MNGMRMAAGLLAVGLLAACDPGAPGTVASDPMTAGDDTVADMTESGDPMDPGAIDETSGTQIPGE
jgi:hypothetical protein